MKKWVKNIHNAIHSQERWAEPRKFVIVNNKRHYIRTSAIKNLPLVRIEGVLFIKQNPESPSEWGALAKAGKRVTQVIKEGKYYGVIIEDKVMRYMENRKVKLVGTLENKEKEEKCTDWRQ